MFEFSMEGYQKYLAANNQKLVKKQAMSVIQENIKFSILNTINPIMKKVDKK